MGLFYLVIVVGFLTKQSLQDCLNSSTYRPSENSDMAVHCGAQEITLSLLLCPVFYGGYNESLLALDGRTSSPECGGEVKWDAASPSLRFSLDLNETSLAACGNTIQITESKGAGIFSEYSSVPSLTIRGSVRSRDSVLGTISYTQELLYLFSCSYSLQYLTNSREMSVYGRKVSMRDVWGKFVSDIDLQLYSGSYRSRLYMPYVGLPMKTRIYVEVMASNLTRKFNVFLDSCCATTSPIHGEGTRYDLFVGCERDAHTRIPVNGEGNFARFSFEAFRFVEHRNLTVSTFYLECTVRLCEDHHCLSLRNCSHQRSRRDVADTSTIVQSVPIFISNVRDTERTETAVSPLGLKSSTHAMTAGIVGVLVLIGLIAAMYQLIRRTRSESRD